MLFGCLNGELSFVNCVWFLFHQVLRQLQQGLAKCYSVAFEKSGAVSDAKITPHTLNFVKKLVSTFGVGLENVSNVSTMFSSAASESLARRAQATAQDPVFQKLKGQFTTGESGLVLSAVGKFALTVFLPSLTYKVTVFVYYRFTEQAGYTLFRLRSQGNHDSRQPGATCPFQLKGRGLDLERQALLQGLEIGGFWAEPSAP